MILPLLADTAITPWSDEEIQPGDFWKKAIDDALERSSVAIVLVSANYLASSFISKVELPYILTAVKQRGLKLHWFLISHCHHERTGLADYQAAHNPSVPLSVMPASEVDSLLKAATQQIAS
jgi:hypothetical protein